MSRPVSGALKRSSRRQAPLAGPQHACLTLWGFRPSRTSTTCKKT
ncbi:hypothetical protein CES86_2430 [Brucella lupini]|uniref:Uncharacterized protein n=1 Tax=Brucella lupini TaxID=255457 RepID=A0A256GRR0_9HYPH|nr:hypothetical protein CES86_2430 [Brucella lupini]